MPRLQAHGSAQGRDGFIAASGIAQRQPEFALSCGPARLRGGEGLEDQHGAGEITGAATGHAEQQRRGRVLRDRCQDFARLFGGQTRLGGEQLFGVGKRHVQGPHGFRPARHPMSPCFDTTAGE